MHHKQKQKNKYMIAWKPLLDWSFDWHHSTYVCHSATLEVSFRLYDVTRTVRHWFRTPTPHAVALFLARGHKSAAELHIRKMKANASHNMSNISSVARLFFFRENPLVYRAKRVRHPDMIINIFTLLLILCCRGGRLFLFWDYLCRVCSARQQYVPTRWENCRWNTKKKKLQLIQKIKRKRRQYQASNKEWIF